MLEARFRREAKPVVPRDTAAPGSVSNVAVLLIAGDLLNFANMHLVLPDTLNILIKWLCPSSLLPYLNQYITNPSQRNLNMQVTQVLVVILVQPDTRSIFISSLYQSIIFQK